MMLLYYRLRERAAAADTRATLTSLRESQLDQVKKKIKYWLMEFKHSMEFRLFFEVENTQGMIDLLVFSHFIWS